MLIKFNNKTGNILCFGEYKESELPLAADEQVTKVSFEKVNLLKQKVDITKLPNIEIIDRTSQEIDNSDEPKKKIQAIKAAKNFDELKAALLDYLNIA